MDQQTFLRRLETELSIPKETLQAEYQLADISQWDSMTALGYMAFVDRELGRTISGSALEKCKYVSDLAELALSPEQTDS